MKQYYSCAELAEMRLEGCPSSKKGFIDYVTRENWPSKKRTARGGGNEYQPPKALLALINNQQLIAKVAVIKNTLPAEMKPPVVTALLNTHQIDVMQARSNLMRFVCEYQGSVESALSFINAAYQRGDLNSHLIWSLKNAWDKPREPLEISRSTYNKWLNIKKTRGVATPLVKQKDLTVKPWHAAAVALIQRPQGTTKQYILESLQPQFKYLSYGMVNRFFNDKFSKSDALIGRHTGSALKAKQKYHSRDTKDIEPWGELHMDGWATHFTAPHPVSGQFVTYEIWHAHDLATKYTPPVSVGLTENFEVIAKCIENAIRFGGVPRIIQTDSTKIIKNSARMKTDPHTALADRMGFTFVHPKQVGNSQANGTPENYNTTLDRASRELATYQAKGMDSLTLKRVKKITAHMAKAQAEGDIELAAKYKKEAEKQGKGIVFASWHEAVAWINDVIEKTNNRPHRSLEKIIDGTTGKLRHLTPKEALQQWVNKGWKPITIDEATLDAAFKIHVKVRVTREMVSPYGGMKYSAPELNHHNGELVVVVYDSMDFEKVWVKDLNGSLICTANFMHAIKRAQNFMDYSDEKRALAQIKRRNDQIEQIKQNTPSLGGDVIEGNFKRNDDGLKRFEFDAPEPKAIEQSFEFDMPEKTTEKTYSETLMWLYGDDKKPTEDDTDKPNNENLAVASGN